MTTTVAEAQVTADAIATDRLLCERCGYAIEGLPTAASCPECGKPVAESLPGSRPGTPWQVRRSLTSLVQTNLALLRRPRAAFELMRIERAGSLRLLLTNLLLAAILISSPWVGTLIGDPARSARTSGPWMEAVTFGWVTGAWVGLITLVLLGLVAVEYRGIRFIAARRGWRLGPEAAWQICAHASVGWMFAGLFPLLLMAVMTATRGEVIEWISAPIEKLMPRGGRPVNVSFWVTGAFVAVGYFAGMFVFELLVYFGVRTRRYANPL